MNEASVDICCVCQEREPVNRVVLECGHAYHPDCAVRWFRFNSGACPLCRSLGAQAAWQRPSDAQRVRTLRCRIAHLPPPLRTKVRQHDAWCARLVTRNAELSHLLREHKEVLDEYKRAVSLVAQARRRKRSLRRLLATSHMGGSFLRPSAASALLQEEEELFGDDSREEGEGSAAGPV
jgi:hypothetical protein